LNAVKLLVSWSWIWNSWHRQEGWDNNLYTYINMDNSVKFHINWNVYRLNMRLKQNF